MLPAGSLRHDGILGKLSRDDSVVFERTYNGGKPGRHGLEGVADEDCNHDGGQKIAKCLARLSIFLYSQ